MSATEDSIYEVAVVGGGPAGAAAATALARAGRRVLLVDQTDDHPGFKVGEGLPGAAKRLLQDLGALNDFVASGHLPSFGNETVWGTPEPVVHDFIRDPDGNGWHLHRVIFDRMMRRLAKVGGVHVRSSARLESFIRERRIWTLHIRTDSGVIAARALWLVDATGRSAHIARRLGETTVHSDRQIAWVSVYAAEPNTAEDRDSFTLIESAPDGWWYTAALPAQLRVVAFFTDNDLDAASTISKAEGFDEALGRTTHIQKRIGTGRYKRVLGPRGAPASGSHLSRAYGDGWIAVGDAAVAFDPLSSQGIFTALYGGLRAAEALDGELSGSGEGLDAFSEDVHRVHTAYCLNRLRIYAQERRWSDREFWRRRHNRKAS